MDDYINGEITLILDEGNILMKLILQQVEQGLLLLQHEVHIRI